MMKKIIVICIVLGLLLANTGYNSLAGLSESENLWNEIKDAIELVANTACEKNGRSIGNRAEQAVKSDLISRYEAIQQMALRTGTIFDKISVSADIIDISEESLGRMVVEVYETTHIDYHYPGQEPEGDYMSYRVLHTVTLSREENSWIILADSYDERDVTGIASSDVLANGLRASGTVEAFPEICDFEVENSEKGVLSFYHTTTTVANALNYAVTYCGISAAERRGYYLDSYISNQSSNPLNYNPAYYSHTYDCANFVSQCLKYAGLPEDSTWYYGAWNANWVGAYNLEQYLMTKYSSVLVNSNYGNVYPGNPVYWRTDSGEERYHQMICVGKNSAGIPVVCGHTTDIYRVPVSNYSSTHILRTILIASSNLHNTHTPTSAYYHNSATHYHICSSCEYRSSVGTHVSNGHGACSICGASGSIVFPQ